MSVIGRICSTAALCIAGIPAFAQPLTLDEALRIGEAQSPRLAAQRAMLSSASEQVGRAGELPDPKLRLGIDNLPVSGPDRFRYDRDFMTMRTIGVAQEFPNSAKREVEGANLAAQRAMLARDTALVWLDAHYAESARGALERCIAANLGMKRCV